MLSVAAENINCFDSGVICRKSLLINIGRSFIAFDDDSGKPVRVTVLLLILYCMILVAELCYKPGTILCVNNIWEYFSPSEALVCLQSLSSVVDRKQRMFIWPAGYFTVVHFPEEDFTVLWDRKTTVHIQVGPRWQVGASTLWHSMISRQIKLFSSLPVLLIAEVDEECFKAGIDCLYDLCVIIHLTLAPDTVVIQHKWQRW